MGGRFWGRFVSPSAVEFFKEGRRTSRFSLFDWLHGYVYARWPYLYIGIGTGEHRAAKVYLRLSRLWCQLCPAPHKAIRNEVASREQAGRVETITFADTYHGKVVPLKAAKDLVTLNQEIRITNLEKVIPYARARDILLENPDHIVALECPCRAARPHPCLPLDVCLIVGEPFASFVTEHHPRRSRRITQAEAVEILKAEDERGHVHHAFFKDAMLGRFYAICNCCSCCCGAMQAQRNGVPMLASSGYVAQVDEALCIGCGDCREFCQFQALALDAYVSAVDAAKCMGCGVCVGKCAQGALSLVHMPEKGEPLEIFALLAQAA